VVRALFNYLAWRLHRLEDNRFDARYDIDTRQGDGAYLQQLAVDFEASAKCAVPYEAVQLHMFRRMLGEISLDRSKYSFVDLGSGKGRAVFLAAKAGFSQVIGVELSSEIHRTALANLSAFTRKEWVGQNIQLVCQDAIDYEFPSQNLVLFLYNPFFGEVMQAMVRNLSRFLTQQDKDLFILYRNPQCADLLDQLPELEVIASTGSYRIYRRRPAIQVAAEST
jgi:SAM-dependent methyltransferase